MGELWRLGKGYVWSVRDKQASLIGKKRRRRNNGAKKKHRTESGEDRRDGMESQVGLCIIRGTQNKIVSVMSSHLLVDP